MSMGYNVGDCGLLVGMLRTPQGYTEENFFKQEVVEHLSGNYLAGLHEKMKESSPEIVEKYSMFKPIGFKMLGEHNVGFLMLIDDFAYPNRIFHPAHGLRNDEDEIFDYDYQISTCIDTYEKNTGTLSLETFFNKVCVEGNYPFLCIGQLKVNNGLLLGNGIDYIELVKKGIQKVAEVFPAMKIRVLDCLGSSELVVVAFSYNLSSIALFTHKVRSLRFESLKELDKEMYKIIEKRSLSYGKNDVVMMQQEQRDSKDLKVGEKFDIGKSHLFAFAYSYLGYRIDIIDGLTEQLNSRYMFENEDQNLSIFLRFVWEIKPGHSEGIKRGLKDIVGESPKDFLYIKNSSWVYSLPYLYKEKEDFFFKVERIKCLDKDLEHSRKLSICVNVEDRNELCRFDDSFVEKFHPSLNVFLKKQRFEELNKIRRNLDLCHVSKVMRERVMKMYNNYNNCVKDPGFFISFLDLKGFLQTVSDRLENYLQCETQNRESLMDLHNWLNLCVASFEQAYFNRFHQSNRMREISDFNLEWNGGIQQLVSPFDFVWKSINRYLGKQDIRFMYVSGYERVHVSPLALRINMFHLTYPELFVLSVWKEVFNRSLPELYKNEVRDSFDFEQKKEAMNLFELVKQYKTSQYQEYLKVEIGQDVDFDITSTVHQCLYEDFDQEFYVSLVADSMAFYIGYNGDIDLFVYYYWRFLFQTTYYYNQDGQLESEVFLRMLCRILFVMSLEHGDKIEELRLKPFDPTLGEYWIDYFDETLQFVNILVKVLHRNMYIDSIKGSAFVLMYDEMEQFCQRQKRGKYYESIREILTKSENDDRKFEKWLDKAEDQILTPLILRHKLFDDAQKKCYKEMKSGGVVRENLQDTPELFLNTLFYAFLKYLRFLDTGKKEVTTLLKVRPQKMMDKECLQYMSNIVPDHSGGMFVVDYKVRRNYFAARASLYRSIFDYCMRNKYVAESVKKVG